MSFWRKENLIVYTKGKYRDKEEIFSDYNGRLKNIALVVLINEGSAVCSQKLFLDVSKI